MKKLFYSFVILVLLTQFSQAFERFIPLELFTGGKIIRQLTVDEIEAVKQNAIRYQENWKKYSKSVF